jgi:hypothetical protein
VTDLATEVLPRAPFRGIESFRYIDAPIFFGRDNEAWDLVKKTAIYRGVLLYGASGAGKSSLIHAGVLPRVLAEGFVPDRLRVQPRSGEEIVVERLPLSDDKGAAYLPSFFDPSPHGPRRIVLSVEAFLSQLDSASNSRRPLLMFDQFEEIVTLFEEVNHDNLSEARAAQSRILDALITVIRDTSLPVKLLLVFREDYLAKLMTLFKACPNLFDHYLRLLPLPTSAAYQIIRGPFEKFPGQFGTELSADLARGLASAIDDHAGSRTLTELQVICLRLWQAEDPESAFDQLGVQGLLEDYMAAALDNLGDELRDPALSLLEHLVTSSGTRNVVSGEDLIQRVESAEHFARAKLERALLALETKARLLLRERRRDLYVYEIVSEFLVPWISRHKAERLAHAQLQVDIERAEQTHKARLHAFMTAHSVEDRILALAMFEELLTPQGTRNSVSSEALSSVPLGSDVARRDVLRQLVQQGIVTLEPRLGGLFAQLSDDVLVKCVLEVLRAEVATRSQLVRLRDAMEALDAALKADFRVDSRRLLMQRELTELHKQRAQVTWTAESTELMLRSMIVLEHPPELVREWAARYAQLPDLPDAKSLVYDSASGRRGNGGVLSLEELRAINLSRSEWQPSPEQAEAIWISELVKADESERQDLWYWTRKVANDS